MEARGFEVDIRDRNSISPNIGRGGKTPAPNANFGFETTRINCAPVVLNCAEIFPSVTDPTMQLRRGWGILRIQPFKPPIADFLTQSLEVEFCGIVLTFFLKISTSS